MIFILNEEQKQTEYIVKDEEKEGREEEEFI
jgi:hypothetical protein